MKTMMDSKCPRCGNTFSTNGLSVEETAALAADHVCPDGVAHAAGMATTRVVLGPGERNAVGFTTPIRPFNIIARKPVAQSGNGEWIVVDRGEGVHMRFVSATADTHSLEHGEWYWGHYFHTREQAMAHFNER